jgi:hypothetical protein
MSLTLPLLAANSRGVRFTPASGFSNCSSNNRVDTSEVEVELKPNVTYALTTGTGVAG